MKISKINIYPIKSLPGISVESAVVGNNGLVGDREYMIVEKKGSGDMYKFLSQRLDPQLTQISVNHQSDLLVLLSGNESKTIGPNNATENTIECDVWGTTGLYKVMKQDINDWLSAIIGKEVFLVKSGDRTNRVKNDMDLICWDRSPLSFFYDTTIANIKEGIDQEWENFRYNFLIDTQNGSEPFSEDLTIGYSWKIGKTDGVMERPISRCKIVGTNPSTGERSKEVLTYLMNQGRNKPVDNMHGSTKKGVFAGVGGFFPIEMVGEKIHIGDGFILGPKVEVEH